MKRKDQPVVYEDRLTINKISRMDWSPSRYPSIIEISNNNDTDIILSNNQPRGKWYKILNLWKTKYPEDVVFNNLNEQDVVVKLKTLHLTVKRMNPNNKTIVIIII